MIGVVLAVCGGVVGCYAVYHSNIHVPLVYQIGKVGSFMFFPGEDALRTFQMSFQGDETLKTPGTRRPCSLCTDAPPGIPHTTTSHDTYGDNVVHFWDNLWNTTQPKDNNNNNNTSGVYLDHGSCVPVKGMYGFDKVGVDPRKFIKNRMQSGMFSGRTPYVSRRIPVPDLSLYYRQDFTGSDGFKAGSDGPVFIPPCQQSTSYYLYPSFSGNKRYWWIAEQLGFSRANTAEINHILDWSNTNQVQQKTIQAVLAEAGYPAFYGMKLTDSDYLISLEYTPSATLVTKEDKSKYVTVKGVNDWTVPECQEYIERHMTCSGYSPVAKAVQKRMGPPLTDTGLWK